MSIPYSFTGKKNINLHSKVNGYIFGSFLIFRHLHTLAMLAEEPPQGISCKVIEGMEVNRDSASEYYISEAKYAQDTYPKYCTSYFMLIHINTVKKLIRLYQADISENSISHYTIYLGVLGSRHHIKSNDGKFLALDY